MPKIKVVRKALNGKQEILMQSDDESCIYPTDVLDNMVQAGCTVYLDGKVYKPKKGKK